MNLTAANIILYRLVAIAKCYTEDIGRRRHYKIELGSNSALASEQEIVILKYLIAPHVMQYIYIYIGLFKIKRYVIIITSPPPFESLTYRMFTAPTIVLQANESISHHASFI